MGLFPLHPDKRLLDEHGRDLVLDPDQPAGPPRRLPGHPRTDRRDRTLHRRLQRARSTIRLDQDPRTDPRQSHQTTTHFRNAALVTLEPYHVIGLARDQESPRYDTSLPVAVASIGEIERFVADGIGEPLDDTEMQSLVSDNRMAWDIAQLIGRRNAKLYRNPMMDSEFAV